ncbi:hypothetical protein CB0940_10935 [Cercospora beticola]|uniref:Uncharacterized protein n=1 Tax=Cercospora beticola TaxID=122368 RepID=A0A2G5HCY4_CERBT|nr:hypothetical protein CB0940_10935 [Cercospora beticola]PIA90407.1 hypothetical protein CB0940_10935 [Cercospora beticola]WPB07723.1 hypothetical protein RHO25_012385 [Cercospora beticola]
MLNAQSGTEDYIGNALRQKFAKLKKNATDQYGDFGAAANAAPTPAKKTTKRKSARKEGDEDKEDGEEESAAPKTKKAKTTKKSASAALFSEAIATTHIVLRGRLHLSWPGRGTEDYAANTLRQKFAKMKKASEDSNGNLPTAAPTPAKKTTKRKSAKKEDDEGDDTAAPRARRRRPPRSLLRSSRRITSSALLCRTPYNIHLLALECKSGVTEEAVKDVSDVCGELHLSSLGLEDWPWKEVTTYERDGEEVEEDAWELDFPCVFLHILSVPFVFLLLLPWPALQASQETTRLAKGTQGGLIHADFGERCHLAAFGH